jgi:endonuclease/exonuclease/phosphatase (EEP) superfamily protein YafD
MQFRRRRIPAHERSKAQRVLAFVGAGWDLLAWAYLLLAFVVALSRPIGGAPPPLVQALQAGFPLVMAPLAAVLTVAVLTRRWIQALAAMLLGATAWFAISPALGRDQRPFWATNGERLRIAEANIYFRNPTPNLAAEALLDAQADIVFVSELTPAFVAEATRLGFDDRYPYRILDPVQAVGDNSPSGGLGLYSKYPFDDVTRVGRDRAPFARILLPRGRAVRVLPVHVESPAASIRVRTWSSDLARLGRLVESSTDPVLFVGDFNATRWQPAFGALLRRGLTDAHEAVGRGLSRSWKSRFAVFRLDHALMSPELVATEVTDIVVPGSDHRGFVADLVAQPMSGTAPEPLPSS